MFSFFVVVVCLFFSLYKKFSSFNGLTDTSLASPRLQFPISSLVHLNLTEALPARSTPGYLADCRRMLTTYNYACYKF